MLVIAHYRSPKIWFQLIGGSLVLVFFLYLMFWSYGGHLISRSAQSPRAIFLIPGLIAAWIYGVITAATIAIKIRQLLLKRGEAVWISEGKLIFMRSWYVSLPCKEIIGVSRGEISISTFVKNEGVVLRMRDGTQEIFPTSSLLESRDAIIIHVKSALESEAEADR